MTKFGFAVALLGALASIMTPGTSSAVVTNVGFSGVLSSASNYVSNDPDIPSGDFFKIGQAFSGSVTYDTSKPGFLDSGAYFFDLLAFDIMIDGKDFSSRFLPRWIGREPDGNLSFLAGGADQGGSAELAMNIGAFSKSYPTAAQLNAADALFSFADYYPGGGIISGQAVLTAIVPPVPETATWAMIILGIGAVGASLRRTGYSGRSAKMISN